MWQPNDALSAELDSLAKKLRSSVTEQLDPLIDRYLPAYREIGNGAEYRKLIELSVKMQLVGMAWTEICGERFDARRGRLSALFAACCHIGDGFLDDYGIESSLEYVQRFEVFLTRGWFDIRNDMERLFYIIVTRMVAERDIMQPMLRQAICSLFKVQTQDVQLTARAAKSQASLKELRECGRDRSGHAITVLVSLLVAELPLTIHHVLYKTGSLISYIDDYGDFYYDQALGKATYMNRVRKPAQKLKTCFLATVDLIDSSLPGEHGRDLLKTFLHRYYVSRLRKHETERQRIDRSRPVYE